MRDHSECKRAYIRDSKAFYSNVLNGKIGVMVGMYHPEGGTTGEFQFEWEEISGKLTPRLKAFDDSWSALKQFDDLLTKMAEIDGEDISEPEFCDILDELGIIDITQYERGKRKNEL